MRADPRLAWRAAPVLVALIALAAPCAPAQANVRGTVSEAADSRPLPGVIVEILGARVGTSTNSSGRYEIRGVRPGSYTLRARGIGLRAEDRELVLRDGDSVTADFALQPLPVSLADIIVTPSRTAISQDRAVASATLSTEDIQVLPQLGEDIYRAITRLPGVSSSEFSAKFWVRGGPERELLTRFDGVDLLEPFHLKDFDGSLSIIDAATIGRVDLISGGFTAEFGDRLTGVLAMETVPAPLKGTRNSLGLSITNARVSSLGSYAGGKGQWLVAARRGYLDIALKLIGNDNDLSPRYYDVSARTEYRVDSSNTLSLHLLRAGDTMDFTDDFGRILKSSYGSTFLWAGWRAVSGRALTVNTIASIGHLTWNRHGDARSVPGGYLITDGRSATIAGVRQDWTLGLSEKLMLKWGLDLKTLAGRYDYDATETLHGDFHLKLRPNGRSVGAYLAARARPIAPLTVELGGRFDSHSYISEKRLSPRLNAALELGRGTVLRGAWGTYTQAPGIHEIQVQDGEESFRPAERAVQLVVGLEKTLSSGIAVRIEAYDRRYTRLNPIYLNLRNGSEVFPEAEFDRAQLDRSRGRSRGVELLVQRREGRKFDWAASYAYAKTEDDLNGLLYITIPRTRDQRHTLYFDFTLAPSAKWRLSWAWQFHTGWPYSIRTVAVDTLMNGQEVASSSFASVNDGRLPAYHRLDVRVTRQIPLQHSAFRVFVDVFNLYDRGNPRGYDYILEHRGGRTQVRFIPDNQLPFLPSFGVSFDF